MSKHDMFFIALVHEVVPRNLFLRLSCLAACLFCCWTTPFLYVHMARTVYDNDNNHTNNKGSQQLTAVVNMSCYCCLYVGLCLV